MVSGPWTDSFPAISERVGVVSDQVDRDALLRQIEELRKRDHRSQEVSERRIATELSLTQRIAQLEAELEACRNNLQELNLLDGFLRSGAVRAINLEEAPALKELLTNFLAQALQTALDTGSVRFTSSKKQ